MFFFHEKFFIVPISSGFDRARRPWAPMFTNFEVEASTEKTQFFRENFPKNALKRLLLVLFFKNCACGAKNMAKTRFFQSLEKLGKSI